MPCGWLLCYMRPDNSNWHVIWFHIAFCSLEARALTTLATCIFPVCATCVIFAWFLLIEYFRASAHHLVQLLARICCCCCFSFSFVQIFSLFHSLISIHRSRRCRYLFHCTQLSQMSLDGIIFNHPVGMTKEKEIAERSRPFVMVGLDLTVVRVSIQLMWIYLYIAPMTAPICHFLVDNALNKNTFY